MTEEEFYNKLVHLGAPQDILEACKMPDPGNKQYVFDWVINNVVGRSYNGITPDLQSGDRGSIPFRSTIKLKSLRPVRVMI